jgi:hypothetical protein
LGAPSHLLPAALSRRLHAAPGRDRRCSAAWYRTRPCQVAHWPAHPALPARPLPPPPRLPPPRAASPRPGPPLYDAGTDRDFVKPLPSPRPSREIYALSPGHVYPRAPGQANGAAICAAVCTHYQELHRTLGSPDFFRVTRRRRHRGWFCTRTAWMEHARPPAGRSLTTGRPALTSHWPAGALSRRLRLPAGAGAARGLKEGADSHH